MTKLNVTIQEHARVLELIREVEGFNLPDKAYTQGLARILGQPTYERMQALKQIRMVVHAVPGIPYLASGKVVKRFESERLNTSQAIEM